MALQGWGRCKGSSAMCGYFRGGLVWGRCCRVWEEWGAMGHRGVLGVGKGGAAGCRSLY